MGFLMPSDFLSLVEDSKEIEGKALPHLDYSGKTGFQRVIDLSPEEYGTMSFSDLLNFHDKVEKIMVTSKLGVYSTKPDMRKEMVKKTEEVESKLKEITSEAMRNAQKISAQPEIKFEKSEESVKTELQDISIPNLEEKELQKSKEEVKPAEFDFEIGSIDLLKKPEKKIEKLPEIPEETLTKKDVAPEIKFEDRGIKKPENVLISKEPESSSVPPLLSKTNQSVVKSSFDDFEDKFKSEWEEKKDEIEIKRKMLELTKDLFREKSNVKRDEIKKQIVTLRDILSRPAAERGSKKSAKQSSYSSAFMNTLLNTQLSEFSASKDSISSSYSAKVEELKKSLSVHLSEESEPGKRSKLQSDFVDSIKNLKSQLPAIVSKYKAFLIDKHSKELERLKLSIEDQSSSKSCQKSLDELDSKYNTEFDQLQTSIEKNLDSFAFVADVKSSSESAQEQPEKVNVSEVISEINEVDEGSMLYYLHSNDLVSYKKYERKNISKHDAIIIARKMMAKERGLSPQEVNKYFGV